MRRDSGYEIRDARYEMRRFDKRKYARSLLKAWMAMTIGSWIPYPASRISYLTSRISVPSRSVRAT